MKADFIMNSLLQIFCILKLMLGIKAFSEYRNTICLHEQHILVTPFISSVSGKFVSNFSSVSLDNKPSSEGHKRTQNPWELYVTIPLNTGSITLELYKQNIHTSRRHREWTSGNITYSEILEEDCFYQGSVIGQDRSFAAVSLCEGLNGYVQTEDYDISIDHLKSKEDGNTYRHHIKMCSIPKDIGRMRPIERYLKRTKRQTNGGRKYLEVLIAADTSVTALVGVDKLETYLLTLMNIVNNIYKHKTLKVDIEVITVKTLQLDKQTEGGIISKNDARKTVDNFCRWTTKQAYNKMSGNGGYHFDVAILLTRTGIGPAGYAPITGMCNPSRSCAVVKDEGFTSAFIIAHEVAHVFGLFHNGHGNTCSGRQYETSIMNAMVRSNLQHYWWTDCSNKKMKEVLPSLRCLNNRPSTSEFVEPPLGKKFSLSEQCRNEFGAGNVLCRRFYGDICAMLWCSGPSDRGNGMCKTKRSPPLEGTPCGPEKHCENHRCVYFGYHTPVNGGWSSWGTWTSCSSACGVGLRQRTRDCTNPEPKYDGKECTGPSEEMDTCKSTECTSFTDVRKVQCSMLDSMEVRPGQHNWKPYQVKDSGKLCVLSCVSSLNGEIATFDNIPVDNGVPCSYDDRSNICVDGKCIDVGCDGKMNSTAREDKCGVCEGDGSQCKTVKGRFHKKFVSGQTGYVDLLLLPKGARNIEIKELSTASHFLALQNHRYGTFILNGERSRGPSHDFAAAGAWFLYKNSYPENLQSKGPIQNKLKVLVYPGNRNTYASYEYQYTISKDDNTHEKMMYYYKYEGWTDCSVTCGTGEQRLIYGCYSKENDTKVDREKCRHLKDPAGKPHKCERRACRAHQLRWAMLNDWTDCNETCGVNGIQHQLYKCEKETNGKIEYVELSFCDEVLPPPTYSRACNRVRCPEYVWTDTGKWSACSSTCGSSGERVKIYHCADDSKKKVNNNLCKDPKPKKTTVCNRHPCIKESYKLSPTENWGHCSATCGENRYQTKLKECIRINSRNETVKVSMSKCSDLQEEDEIRPCTYVPCYQATYDWLLVKDWSTCSQECGDEGIQHQLYRCFDVTYEYAMKNVEDDFCNESGSANVTRPCNRFDCFSFKWLSQSWSDCSSTCGNDGIRRQTFSCSKVYFNKTLEDVDSSYCSNMSYPVITENCNRVPCESKVYSWVMVPNWAACSVSCGEGTQSALYKCFEVYKNDTMMPASADHLCSHIEKPHYERPCSSGPCEHYQWSKAFDWTACSTSCGEDGIQRKIHVCEKVSADGSVIPTSSSFCKNLPDISEMRSCNRIPCVSWRYRITQSPYLSECSETCGSKGIQFYQYSCEKEFSNNGTTVVDDMEHCRDILFPNRTYPCNRTPCPREWVTDNWGRCSVSCGVGVQRRYIFCGSIEENLNPSECPGTRPVTTKVCSQPECRSEVCVDRISLCSRGATRSTCRYRGYKFMCCASCKRFRN
ncbi:LOW QUALITY PROTEIN: A disintegrin and metalloproteinase with thrombospondin motifs 3-like [Saccostrea cucullata]|uniref:LOW QUALITY PROTEIN: A disintegrin and metalloproteinase with thrombospondin motifs 3-like n=1 Tax=Saccostrea cuccullata TaxID=36930 RepID=UPI002ED1EDC8